MADCNVLNDEQLRLECARLVAVFTNGQGDQVEMTDKMFRYIRNQKDSGNEARSG